LLEAARQFGAIADFLVIPSNGPHLLQPEIERAAGRKVLSIIDVTLEEVRRRSWQRVGVVGVGDPLIYTRRLDSLSVAHEVLEPARREPIDAAIFRVMEGREDDSDRRLVHDAVAWLRGRRVDGIILGCTELPLLLREHAEAADLLNPAQLLAEAAVQLALA